MAIEYNYDGPPSLEIYQDFVRTSTTGADAQSVVVVAEHYDVVKKDYNPEGIKAKAYDMSAGVSFDWSTDLKTTERLVDKNSIRALMSNVYAVKKSNVSATCTKANGNQLKVTDPSGIYVGDIVAVPGSNGSKTIAKIISMASSGAVADPKISVLGTDTAGAASKFKTTGKYTGNKDRRYYVEVTATSTNTITTKVTTADGTDGAASCAIPVSTDGAKSVALANSGLKVYVTASDITKSTYFVIDVTAGNTAKDLINLDKVITATAESTKTVEIGGLVKDCVIGAGYITAGTNVTISSGVVTPDNKTVMSGDVFIEYRATSSKFYNKLGTVSIEDGSSIEDVVGYTGIENPLGAMASVALKGGASLYCTSVNADTAAEYQRAFAYLSRSTDTYAIVIGSLRADVIGNLATFLKACADPKVANYKIGYYGLDINNESVIWGGSLATLTNNKVTCADGGFLTKGVHNGDVISILNSATSSGDPEYKDYTIISVVSDTEAEVSGADNVTQPVPVSFTVTRTLTGSEFVTELKSRVYTNNHRCYCVFGDGITVDGIEDAPSWLLAALPAGMRAAEYVQRPISNLAYDGCSAVNKLNLTAADMKDLASRGVWILANDTTGSVVYNYHQLSTDMSDKKYQEQSYTTNFDNISRSVRALLSPYYGNSNISSDLFNQILADITSLLDLKVMRVPSINIGPQLISYSNLKIEQDPVNQDHVYMYVDYQMPAPFNHVVAKQRLI